MWIIDLLFGMIEAWSERRANANERNLKPKKTPRGKRIRWTLLENNDLIFIAWNSIKGMSVSIADPNKKQQSGIGLDNVKKRLDLYYGNKYSFKAQQEDNSYVVTIKIGDKYNEKKV